MLRFLTTYLKGGEYNIPALQMNSLRSEWLSYLPKTTDLVSGQLDLNIDLFDFKSLVHAT